VPDDGYGGVCWSGVVIRSQRNPLALAERGVKGAGGQADQHGAEAAEIIDGVAAALSPERAAAYVAATPVVEALALAR
jgi:hypothetical protein